MGQAGTAAGYPDIVNAEDEVAVTVGIINNEHIKTGYRLEVAIDNNLVHSVSPITLGNGETWKREVTFKPGMPGKKIKGEFSLFKLGKPEKAPYRKLYIWMDVKNNDTTNSI